MGYLVILANKALASIEKVPIAHLKRILDRIKWLSDDAYPIDSRVDTDEIGVKYWHILVGDYFIYYQVIEVDRLVKVFDVIHRNKVSIR